MRDQVVLSPELSDADARDFDRFVDAARLSHYSQTRAWAPVGVCGRPMVPWYFLHRREGRVQSAAVLRRVKGIGPLYLPSASIERGPAVESPADLAAALAALRHASLRRGILRLSVMPYAAGDDLAPCLSALQAAGFKYTQRFDGSHARSLRLSLAGVDAASKKARAETRRAEREGARTRRATQRDLPAIAALHEQMMGAQKKSGKSLAYFELLWAQLLADGKRGAIFLCETEQVLLSFALLVQHANMSTYVMGASAAVRTPYNKMFPALLAGTAWAQETGCQIFDLGGIPMAGDTDPKRTRIAEFKSYLSKDEVSLVGEHTRWF